MSSPLLNNMNAVLILLNFIFFVSIVNADSYVLDFTENGRFVEIFDSGIRPHYFSDQQKNSLQVRDITLSVSHHSMTSNPIKLERMVIDLIQNKKLSQITLYGEELFTESEVKLFLKNHGLNHDKMTAVLNGESWSLVNTDQSQVLALGGIAKSYIKETPYKFIGSIRWRRPMKESISFSGVITPPKKYESVSLQFSQKDLSNGSSEKLGQTSTVRSEKPLPVSNRERRAFPFVIVGFGLVLIACVVVFIVRTFKNRR